MLQLLDKREVIYVDAKKHNSQKINVAAYARVSSGSEEQLNSFSTQVNYYSSYINDNENWQMVDVYADEGITGVSRDKRTDFNRMISDCEKGKIDRIITKSISRFARNNVDTIDVTRKLKQLGISVYFESENLDTANMSSEFLLSIRATFAQQESMNISVNVKKGKRNDMKMGEFALSNPPYGYRLENKKLVPYEPEVKIVRRIFYDYINGKGCMTIAKELDNEKIPRKDGEFDWRRKAIIFILKNEKYIGDSLYQKAFNEEQLPYRQHRNKGELDKFYVKGTHKGIISRADFNIANEMLNSKKDSRLGQESFDYILSKKIKCKNCGSTFRKKISNGKSYWVCRTYDTGKELCNSKWISEDSIYDAYIIVYQTLKANMKSIFNPIVQTLNKVSEINQKSNKNLQEINSNIAELSRQNGVLTDLMNDGILDSAVFITQTDEINRQLKELKTDKKRLLEEIEDTSLIQKTELLMSIIETGPEVLYEIDKDIFDDTIEKIEISDGNTLEFILINGMRIKEKIN
ncbi:MAG: recombinase family protein [Clostridia bacterium]